ncbi:MAG: M16 family metallopeptidase [Canibacter sp.]
MTEPLLLPLEQPEISAMHQGVSFRRTVHSSGLRVLTENVPGARSASIGFWVPVGSRDEQAEHDGAPASLGSTHFLEHLLFKGTPTRNAYDIAESFDRIGADHNALTAKEYTCYHAKVRDEDLPHALTVLADMVCSSVIEPAEFEMERGVILEELAMAADDLSDVAHERFFEAVLGSHELGRPIGGTPETIMNSRRDEVFAHYHNEYSPSSLVVTAAGAVDHDRFVEQILEALTRAGGTWNPDHTAAPKARRDRTKRDITDGVSEVLIPRQSEQLHVVIGSQGYQSGHRNRFAFGLMNSVLGGGMSSRLFQEIREKRGLAYTAYSFGGSYSDAGVFGMYAACAPEKAGDVTELIRAELRRLADTGITDEERTRSLGQIAGSSALSLEDSDTRMGRLARAELGTGELLDLDSSLERFADVTHEEVIAVARDLVERPASLVAVGAIEGSTLSRRP